MTPGSLFAFPGFGPRRQPGGVSGRQRRGGSVEPSRDGLSPPRPARGSRRSRAGTDRRGQTAGAPRDPAPARQPYGLPRAAHRRALGRERAGLGAEDGADPRVAAAQGASGAAAAHPRPRLPARGGRRRTRPIPFRALGRRRPGGALAEQAPEGEGATGRRACPLARPCPRRVRRTLQQARGRASRGASPSRSRIADRGRARAWASTRRRRRARDADCPAPATRAASLPAHARAVPIGAARRGARELPDIPADTRRGARDRAVRFATRAPAANAAAGTLAGATGEHGDARRRARASSRNGHRTPRRRGLVRAKRRPQDRLPGRRRRVGRPRSRPWLGLHVPARLGIPEARGLLPAARVDGPTHPLRQARHRPLRSSFPGASARPGNAHGRRPCSPGLRRLRTGGPAGCLRRRSDVDTLRRDPARANRRTDPDGHLST